MDKQLARAIVRMPGIATQHELDLARAVLAMDTELASLRARIAAALKVCDVIETVRHDAPSLEDPSVVRLTRRIREILEGR